MQNWYQKCNDYYYFNNEKQYFCVDTFPEEYNKLIIEKNKCINKCQEDKEYIYEYSNIINKCLNPNVVLIRKSKNECVFINY